MRFFERIGARAAAWAERTNPWTNVYGLGRTLLALSAIVTLVFSRPESLFCPATGRPYAVGSTGVAAFSFFALLRDHLELARVVAVAALAVVASGWRPRYTALVHWWLAFSFAASATLVDGGDQIAADLCLLLIPVALTDGRRWHWDRGPAGEVGEWEAMRRIVALLATIVIRLQMAGVYFHAALGKTRPQEWLDGTAIYYWFNDPGFGAPAWMMPLLRPLLLNAASVTLLTWGVIALEFLLAAALFMPQRAWRPLLVAAIFFHAGIALIHGLISFAIAMAAGLILYLRPWDRPFHLPQPRSFPARAAKAVPAGIAGR